MRAATHDALPKTESGSFPPGFTDVRPDLSKRTDYVDVCGIGRVPVRPDGQFDGLDEYVANGDRLIEAAALNAAAHGTDVDRALAVYLAGISSRAGPPKDNADTRAWDATSQQLARLAVASKDAAAYALAFKACLASEARTVGACVQISPAHWAQLDPDNAVPLLYEAEAAKRRNDPAGMDAALLRASQAKTFQPYFETSLRLIDTPVVRSAPPAVASAAIFTLVGVAAAVPIPDLQMVNQYCAATAKGAAQRTQVCGGLAEVLAERSAVLISMPLGAVIGERAGWSSERVAAVKTRVAALQKAQTVDLKDLYSCAAVERGRRYFTDFARFGEVGAMERAVIAGQSARN